MHKILISFLALAILAVSGCGRLSGIGDAIPNALDEWSLLYRPDIQQGNVITQEMMDKVQLGMDKRQVRYALGSPVLVDVFHQDRWDYVYTFGRGSTPKEISHSSMYFKDDQLVRIEGGLQPRPEQDRPEPKKEVLVSVPDHEPVNRPLIERMLHALGMGKNE